MAYAEGLGQGVSNVYTIVDDPNTEGDETERVMKALSSLQNLKVELMI